MWDIFNSCKLPQTNSTGNHKMKFVVQHEGVDCLTVLLNTKIAKHMFGYGLIHKDLKLCLSCIEEMGTNVMNHPHPDC
jgi:hypothetical protein